MFKVFLRATALIATLSMTGCVSYTVTGPIAAPLHPVAVSSPRSAQIADVAVSAADVNEANKAAISSSLTAQISQYVRTAGYFKQVTEYPVRLGEQDVTLKFNMTSQRPSQPAPGVRTRRAADADHLDLGQRPDLRRQLRGGRRPGDRRPQR